MILLKERTESLLQGPIDKLEVVRRLYKDITTFFNYLKIWLLLLAKSCQKLNGDHSSTRKGRTLKKQVVYNGEDYLVK